jgi:hypothetical protein
MKKSSLEMDYRYDWDEVPEKPVAELMSEKVNKT